jgi:hypothetical protein
MTLVETARRSFEMEYVSINAVTLSGVIRGVNAGARRDRAQRITSGLAALPFAY